MHGTDPGQLLLESQCRSSTLLLAPARNGDSCRGLRSPCIAASRYAKAAPFQGCITERVGERGLYLGDRLRPGPRRETMLSIFGPLSLFGLFAIWAAGLILGFGLLRSPAAPREGGVGESLYLSGTTFTTLGYGDLAPVGPASRLIAVTEAATGFGFFAIVIAYLPVLYRAFGRRRSLIAILDARAGSPPNAGRAFLRLASGTTDRAVLGRLLRWSEKWAAEVLEAQLSFPVLGYYRSQHDNQSWLAAMTCVLDLSSAPAPHCSRCCRPSTRQAHFCHVPARFGGFVVDTSTTSSGQRRPFDGSPTARTAQTAESQRGHCSRGCRSMERLASLRGLYEPFAAALSKHFRLFLPDVWPETDKRDNWQTTRRGSVGLTR